MVTEDRNLRRIKCSNIIILVSGDVLPFLYLLKKAIHTPLKMLPMLRSKTLPYSRRLFASARPNVSSTEGDGSEDVTKHCRSQFVSLNPITRDRSVVQLQALQGEYSLNLFP